MAIVDRNIIRSVIPVNGKPFYVSEWDGEVCIRKWSGAQRAALLVRTAEVYGQKNLEGMADGSVKMSTQDYPALFRLMAEIVCISLCDALGNNLYDFFSPEDTAEVENFDADLLQKLFEECASRNGLLESAVKEEIKNSETTQN